MAIYVNLCSPIFGKLYALLIVYHHHVIDCIPASLFGFGAGIQD